MYTNLQAAYNTDPHISSGLGDLSGKAKLARRFKGSGMRTTQEIGLDLGRRVVELQ
jgi:hypothetical protein